MLRDIEYRFSYDVRVLSYLADYFGTNPTEIQQYFSYNGDDREYHAFDIYFKLSKARKHLKNISIQDAEFKVRTFYDPVPRGEPKQRLFITFPLQISEELAYDNTFLDYLYDVIGPSLSEKYPTMQFFFDNYGDGKIWFCLQISGARLAPDFIINEDYLYNIFNLIMLLSIQIVGEIAEYFDV